MGSAVACAWPGVFCRDCSSPRVLLHRRGAACSLIQKAAFLSLFKGLGPSGRFCGRCASFRGAAFAELWPCVLEARGTENLLLQKCSYVVVPRSG